MAKALESVVDVEFGRVELLVEIRAAVVSEAVQPSMDLFEKAVSRENATALARVLPDWSTLRLNSDRREVAVLSDQLQDPIVGRHHPVGRLSHVGASLGCTHRLTGVSQFTTDGQKSTDKWLLTLYNRQ